MLVEAGHRGGAGDVRLLVAARGVHRGARHRRLGVLVAPAGHALLLVAAGQFRTGTAARRELGTAAALGGGVAPLRGHLAPGTAEGVLALVPALARGLRGTGRLGAEGTRAGRRGTALRRGGGSALVEQ